MNQKIDLSKIEKKAYMAFHKDGLWDLCLGLTFICIVLGVYYDISMLTPIIASMAIIIVPSLRKSVVIPRMGYVKFSAERQAREKYKMNSLMILFTFTTFLGAFVFLIYTMDMPFLNWVKDLGIIPIGFVMSLVSAVVGHLYEMRRYLIYAAIIMTVFIIEHLLGYRLFFSFSIIGGILIIVGLTMFVQFLVNNTRPNGDETSVNEG